MTEIYGDYIDISDDIMEYLIISFSSSTLPIQERWRTNSLSADFLAEYWGTFFPVHGSPFGSGHDEVKDSVGYIANELLENAIKFGYENTRRTIKIGIYMSDDELRFYVTNSIDPANIRKFKAYIRKILAGDTRALYFQQVEKNATDDDARDSRLGFYTIVNDYNARLAWKFEKLPENPEIEMVTTMVGLEIVRTSQT